MASMHDPDINPNDALALGYLTGALYDLGKRYFDEVPEAERSRAHQAQWMAEELHTNALATIGYHRVTRASFNTPVIPAKEYGVRISRDHSVTPVGSLPAAYDVAENSSTGLEIVERTIGDWLHLDTPVTEETEE